MAYATQQDIVDLRGLAILEQVADREEGGNGIDEDAVERALIDSAAYMESYFGSRYPLPLPSVPTVLRDCNVDLAVYKLAEGPGRGMTKDIREKAERWDCNELNRPGWLQRLGKELVSIPFPTDEDPAPATGAAKFASADRQLSRCSLGGLV